MCRVRVKTANIGNHHLLILEVFEPNPNKALLNLYLLLDVSAGWLRLISWHVLLLEGRINDNRNCLIAYVYTHNV